MSQNSAAVRLKISQPLLYKILKKISDIETSARTNENTDRKRARSGKESQVESALKIWFSNVCEKMLRLVGLLCVTQQRTLHKFFKINVVFYNVKGCNNKLS
jgi:hypothetical protein